MPWNCWENSVLPYFTAHSLRHVLINGLEKTFQFCLLSLLKISSHLLGKGRHTLPPVHSVLSTRAHLPTAEPRAPCRHTSRIEPVCIFDYLKFTKLNNYYSLVHTMPCTCILSKPKASMKNTRIIMPIYLRNVGFIGHRDEGVKDVDYGRGGDHF